MTTKCVLMILADYYDDEKGYAFPSQARLADDCENTIRSTRSALASLETMGFITRIQKGNQQQESRYAFNFSATQARQPETQELPVSGAQAPQPESEEKEVGENISGTVGENRKTSVSEPETPRHTSHKKPPLVTFIVKITMDTLEQVRGYVSTRYPAEAKAIKELAKLGYTSTDILECYTEMKKDKFWKDIPLTVMSVKSNIGEWKNNQKPAEPEGAKYQRDRERLANRPMARK